MPDETPVSCGIAIVLDTTFVVSAGEVFVGVEGEVGAVVDVVGVEILGDAVETGETDAEDEAEAGGAGVGAVVDAVGSCARAHMPYIPLSATVRVSVNRIMRILIKFYSFPDQQQFSR